MPRSDITDFTLEVIDGPRAGQVISLSGRELPYRAGAGGSISFTRNQRTKLTWYPGNPVASQQIIGPTLGPTTINGVWKERYLGEDRPIDLVELCEDLLLSGSQLLVVWSTIVRTGIIKQFTWAPGDPTGGLGDIRWECVFEWNGDGLVPRKTIGSSQSVSLRDGLVTVANDISLIIDSVEGIIDSVSNFVGTSRVGFRATKATLEDEAEALLKPLQTINSSAARMGDEGSLPARFLEDTSAAFGSAQVTTAAISNTAANIFPGNTTDDDAMDTILPEAIDRYDTIDVCFTALNDLFDQRVKVEALVRPPDFTRVPALVGGDLRAIAIQFYGNADLWPRLAKQNGLETSTIPEGVAEIIVPLSLPDSTDQGIMGC